MEDNGAGMERLEGADGKHLIRVKKIPLEDLLNILENLYEAGTNFIDMEFFIDPNEVQSVITITTRPEYMASQEQLDEEEKLFDEYEEDEDEDEDEEDDILARIRREQEEKDKQDQISDDDIDELI